MKRSSIGGRFLAKWQGNGPTGKGSSPLCFQKGQRQPDRIHNFSIDSQGCRIWSF